MISKALAFAAFGTFEYFIVFFPLMIISFLERALMLGSLSLFLGLQLQKSFTEYQFSTVQLLSGIFSNLSLKVFLVILVIYSLFMLSSGCIYALLIKAGLQLYDARHVSFRDLKVSWYKIGNLIVGMYIYGFFCIVGYLFFIIPGILVSVIYGYYRFFIIDKAFGPIASLYASARLTRYVRWDIFILSFILNLFNLIGLHFWGLGLFITLPLGLLAHTYAYRRLSAYQ